MSRDKACSCEGDLASVKDSVVAIKIFQYSLYTTLPLPSFLSQDMKYFFVASLLCGVQQASTRTNAGGACTDITDKAKCCTMYDARLSTAAASNCVPALDTFTNGAKCEAEAMVIERGECALVGLCQDHVQVASAACLNTVVDQVTVKGVM